MLKKLSGYIVIILSFTLATSVYAVNFGVCGYGKDTVSSVMCYGPALLKETTVNGQVIVAGPLKASQSSLRSLQVAGVTELSDTTISERAFVAGLLTADKVHFEHGLSISSNKATLTFSTVKGGVTITARHQKPVLELLCETEVTGPIKFEGKPGVVRVTIDTVIHGKVTNGVIEKAIGKTCG